MRPSRLIPTALVLLALAPGSPFHRLTAPAASAQNVMTKRLILKDGTYQIVTKWEIKHDRVRFYSAERADWEEIPSNLIDWPRTEKWNSEHVPGAPQPATQPPTATPEEQQKEAAEIDAEEIAERGRTPLVAPGLQLPDRDGIFVLDTFQSIPELVHLDQSTGNVNRDANHNVLRAAIGSFSGAKEPVRLDGQAARVRVHVDDPALYVSLDTGNLEQIAPEDALMVNTHGANSVQSKDEYSSPDSRYAIVRVDVHPGERVIGALRITRAGNAIQSEDIVPTKVEFLPGKHWMKLTPKEPLPIGEYALMEILQPGVINLDVWDFGVSPNAPENKHPLTPVKDR
ncbi:MAG TPA: hypothetical protein VGF88_13690 [Acidobacteriaceae bacterium]|jgi:hypothetical protein